MNGKKIDGHVVRLMFQGVEFAIYLSGRIWPSFQIRRRVRQGCLVQGH